MLRRVLGLALGAMSFAQAQVDWNVPMGGNGQRALLAIATSGTSHMAVGRGGSVSFNERWMAWGGPDTAVYQGVAWTGSRYVAVGDSGRIMAWAGFEVPWHLKNSGTSARLNTVAASGSQLVAVGEGVVLTSPDGEAWTSRAHPGGADSLRSALWAGTRWIVPFERDTGGYMASTNGVDWTAKSSGGRPLRSVVWTGTQLVAFCDSGVILSSPDGTAWTVRHPSLGRARPRPAAVWTGTYIVGFDEDTARMSRDGVRWEAYSTGPVGGYPTLQAVWTGKEFLRVRAQLVTVDVSPVMAAPGRPSILMPYPNIVLDNDTLTFRLIAATSGGPAHTYHLQVATDTAFTALVVNDSTIKGTEKFLSLPPGNTYYWRARARNIVSPGPFTARRAIIGRTVAVKGSRREAPSAAVRVRAGRLRVAPPEPGAHAVRVTDASGRAFFAGEVREAVEIALEPGIYFVEVRGLSKDSGAPTSARVLRIESIAPRTFSDGER